MSFQGLLGCQMTMQRAIDETPFALVYGYEAVIPTVVIVPTLRSNLAEFP